MMRSMYSAVSGLKTHQTKMDVIGNNIANVNTVAFKSSSVTFQDILYQTTSGASGANALTGVGGVNAKQIGLGVSMASTSVSIETAGASETTGNPFDIKLTDKNTTNFFIVNDGSQNLFTRAGSFYVDGVGNLCMTSTGYTVMGWQVDETTNEIRKDTVSALRIMQEKNLTSAPEATTNAVMAGVLDENDADVQSDNGKIMNLNFYDSLGYQYTARFSIKAAGEDGKYKVSLSSILNDNNEDMIANYTAEDIAKLFGSYEEEETTYANLTSVNGEFTVNADGTITDGINTYTLNAAGDAFEYSDGTTTTSYTVADVFGTEAADKIADGYTFAFADGSYKLTKAETTTPVSVVDPATRILDPATGYITVGGVEYKLNDAGTAFEAVDGSGATLSISDIFGADAVPSGATLAFDTSAGNYTVTVPASEETVSPTEDNGVPKFTVNADGTITDGTNTYTLNADGTAFEYTDGTTTTSYSLVDVFGDDAAILSTDDSYSLKLADGQYSIVQKSIIVEPEVDTVYSDASLNENFEFQDDGTIKDTRTGTVYEYVSGTEFRIQGSGETVTADVIFNMTENMQQNLGIGIGQDGLNKDSDYEFSRDETTGEFMVTRKVPSYILEFNTATGVFESIDNDPKSVSLKLGDAIGDGNFNKNGNFENISIDFTQCLNYNNGGKSTIGMDSGDVDGSTGKGRKLGNMIGVSIDTNGKIYGSYDNGNTELLGQIAVAQFSNASGLEKVGDSCYQTTLNSGEFDGIGVEVAADGSSMTTGELEMSNVDLSTEFTQMITTQRGFQANSRVITTSDTLLEELVNLKR